MDPSLPTSPNLLRPLVLFAVIFVSFAVFSSAAMMLPIDIFTAIIASQIVVILGGALIYRRNFSRTETRWPTLRRLGIPWWVLVVVITASISLGLLGNVVAAAMIEIFPALEEFAAGYQETIEQLLLGETMRAQILGAISVAIIAPFCEEILFRGTLLPEQQRSQTAMGAILLNGVLFSAMHGNPVAFVSLTIIGCFLAHITLRSGTIWPAIVGHAALNAVNGILLPRVAMDLTAPEELVLSDILIAFAILAIISTALWWLSVVLIKRHPTPVIQGA